LKALPNLDTTDLCRFEVDPQLLNSFSREKVCWPRLRNQDADKLRVYRGPLALIKEAPGWDRTKGWALISFGDVAYSESFNGYSAKDILTQGACSIPSPIVHSAVWLHYALATSPKFGAERRRFYKADLDECPFVPLEQLNEEQRQNY